MMNVKRILVEMVLNNMVLIDHSKSSLKAKKCTM